METNINTIYELWDLSIPNIPEHSSLFHLEPIGIGTPLVESLTSYVKRLANAHSISSRMLILSEIAPLLDVEYVLGLHNKSLEKIYGKRTYALNSVGKMALGLVNALEVKTLRSNLQFLTMLTWRNLIDQRNLMRHHQAWCPFCYQEWYENKQILYEPLYWSLKAINICIKHKNILLEKCPHCQRYLVHLPGKGKPGYCSKCQGWLGELPKNFIIDDIYLPTEHLEWQNFTANNILKLIALAPCLKSIPSNNSIKENLLAIIEKLHCKNLNEFTYLSNIPHGLLYRCIHKSKLTVIDNLLNISYQLGIPLIDFFTKKPAINLTSLVIRDSQKINPYRINKQKEQSFPDLNIAHAQKVIADALKEFPPPSIQQIATRIGCYFTTIRSNFPESYDLIKIRYNDYEIKCLQEKLEAALLEEPPRSMLQISKSLGYKSSANLYRLFPDICYKVSSRYQTYEAEIIKSRCQEIRNIAIRIHKAGKQPSSYNVGALLAQPSIMRNTYAQAELAKVKRELGYE